MADFDTLRTGAERESLEALRCYLVERMEKAEPGVVPQYVAQYRAVIADLSKLPSVERTDVDDLVERRKARRASTDAKLRAKQRRGAGA
jgi:hypothetical protein